MKDLLTVTEAAEIAGCETSVLRRAIIAGTLKAEKFGKTWIIRREDFEKWMATRKRGRPPKSGG